MISGKLVHLIELHGDQIVNRVTQSIRRDLEMTPAHVLLEGELRDWGQDLLQNLGHWLSPAGKEDLGRRYERLGRQLFEQCIPLDEALNGLFVIREKALDYLEEQVLSKTSVELYAEEELDRQLARFFDMLTIHMARGNERAHQKVAVA
jgi:hypothetical protein